MKHGLTSAQIVIKGEDPAAYDALRADLIAKYNPTDELEAMLVEQIAQNWWRLTRARRIEAKMLEQFGEIEAYTNKAYINLQRQANKCEAAWNRAVRDIQKLKAFRAERNREARENAAIASYIEYHRAKRAEIGSVFTNSSEPNHKPGRDGNQLTTGN